MGNAIVSFLGRYGNLLYNPLLTALGVLSKGLTDGSENCCSRRSWEFKSLHFPKHFCHFPVPLCIYANPTSTKLMYSFFGFIYLFIYLFLYHQHLYGSPVRWKLTTFSQKRAGTVLSRFLMRTCLKHQRYCIYVFWIWWLEVHTSLCNHMLFMGLLENTSVFFLLLWWFSSLLHCMSSKLPVLHVYLYAITVHAYIHISYFYF